MILDGVNLHLPHGRMICLKGPSGIGKTTILNVAAGLITPDEGFREIRAERIGYAFQDDRLIPWLSALGNLELTLSPWHRPAQARLKALQWLENVGLNEQSLLRPPQLSGGQCRRLGLARALSVNPDLLILDEPFVFLDEDWQKQAALLIKKHHDFHRAAVLIVSHDHASLNWLNCPVIEINAPISLE